MNTVSLTFTGWQYECVTINVIGRFGESTFIRISAVTSVERVALVGAGGGDNTVDHHVLCGGKKIGLIRIIAGRALPKGISLFFAGGGNLGRRHFGMSTGRVCARSEYDY